MDQERDIRGPKRSEDNLLDREWEAYLDMLAADEVAAKAIAEDEYWVKRAEVWEEMHSVGGEF